MTYKDYKQTKPRKTFGEKTKLAIKNYQRKTFEEERKTDWLTIACVSVILCAATYFAGHLYLAFNVDKQGITSECEKAKGVMLTEPDGDRYCIIYPNSRL